MQSTHWKLDVDKTSFFKKADTCFSELRHIFSGRCSTTLTTSFELANPDRGYYLLTLEGIYLENFLFSGFIKDAINDWAGTAHVEFMQYASVIQWDHSCSII